LRKRVIQENSRTYGGQTQKQQKRHDNEKKKTQERKNNNCLYYQLRFGAANMGDTLDFCCEGVTELQTLPVLMSLSLTPCPKSLTLDSLTTLWEY